MRSRSASAAVEKIFGRAALNHSSVTSVPRRLNKGIVCLPREFAYQITPRQRVLRTQCAQTLTWQPDWHMYIGALFIYYAINFKIKNNFLAHKQH
jgi:hypothetical protein